jgi:RNA 2',3'-cyclic 3'-phosphodiesterase
MSEKTHYFLAMRLPDSIKKDLHQARLEFEKSLTFKRWVHMEDYHITLAFLGFANQNQLIEIKDLVAKQLENEKIFSLTITKLGTFGMETSPRIFWAGLEVSKELQDLREKVYTACGQAGFQLEKRPFHPHITLARKWDKEEKFRSEQLNVKNMFQEKPLTFKATEVVLYRTNLLQTPKYENLITFSLKS